MEIRIATSTHIDKIQDLNNRSLISALNPNGFIRIKYSLLQLQKLINLQEIVVAMDGHRFVGYYLVGRNSGNELIEYQKNKALSLWDRFQIPIADIGYGCQVCIIEEYRNNGVYGQMLVGLCKLVSSKYSHLLCSVSDSNVSSLRAHDNNGWQLIDTMETTKFLIYPTQKSAF